MPPLHVANLLPFTPMVKIYSKWVKGETLVVKGKIPPQCGGNVAKRQRGTGCQPGVGDGGRKFAQSCLSIENKVLTLERWFTAIITPTPKGENRNSP